MIIRFVKDPDTGLPHIAKHGVDESEVFELFDNAPMKLHGRENTLLALGQTFDGRYLKAIYRKDDDGILVITAYDLTGNALRAYRRRRRRKQQ